MNQTSVSPHPVKFLTDRMMYWEVSEKLSRFGCYPIRREGPDWVWFNPITEKESVIPDREWEKLPKQTTRTAVRQLGIGWDEFLDA